MTPGLDMPSVNTLLVGPDGRRWLVTAVWVDRPMCVLADVTDDPRFAQA